MRKYKSELVAGPLHLFYPKVFVMGGGGDVGVKFSSKMVNP